LNVFKTLTRASLAAVWLYQGLWCKLLGREPRHQDIAGAVPIFSPEAAHALLLAIGFAECALAVWVISGVALRRAAIAQTILLLAMNAGGLLWAFDAIPDAVGMLLQNFAFLMLAWTAAREEAPHAVHV
jgi:hypothetical protein